MTYAAKRISKINKIQKENSLGKIAKNEVACLRWCYSCTNKIVI
jgi:hypothetical protein